MRTVDVGPTFEAWQAVARVLLHEAVPPAEVTWREAPPGAVAPPSAPATAGARVPRQFLDLARQAAAAADPARWALLYEILWRLVHERRDLLADSSDPQVRRLTALAAPLRLESPSAAPTGGTGAGAFIPPNATLDELRAASVRCQGCDLFRHATQTSSAAVRPPRASCWSASSPGTRKIARARPSSVRPARCSIARSSRSDWTASTCTSRNAVKHFKFTERGKRRLTRRPRAGDHRVRRPWLEAELEVIRPEVLGVLGATAARVIIGPEFRLLRQHGHVLLDALVAQDHRHDPPLGGSPW
jgi:DNA polymerase